MSEPMEIVFRRDESLDHVKVEFSAPEKTAEIERAMDLLLENEKDILLVATERGTYRIKKNDICRISSDGKYVEIACRDQIYRSKGSLSSFEEKLDQKSFLRISRFEIINLKRVRCYEFTFAGSLRIQLEGDYSAWASRRYIPIIKKILEEGGED